METIDPEAYGQDIFPKTCTTKPTLKEEFRGMMNIVDADKREERNYKMLLSEDVQKRTLTSGTEALKSIWLKYNVML